MCLTLRIGKGFVPTVMSTLLLYHILLQENLLLPTSISLNCINIIIVIIIIIIIITIIIIVLIIIILIIIIIVLISFIFLGTKFRENHPFICIGMLWRTKANGSLYSHGFLALCSSLQKLAADISKHASYMADTPLGLLLAAPKFLQPRSPWLILIIALFLFSAFLMPAENW